MSEPPVVKPEQSLPSNAPPPVVRVGVAATGPGRAETRVNNGNQSRWEAAKKSRGLMLLMLFGVTAALGLPILWLSKAFSRNEKIVWSIIVSVYTVIILWIFFQIMSWSYGRISHSLGW